MILLDFNSHAHVERDPAHALVLYLSHHFNSHAHVERDLKNHRLMPATSLISTHTLTWSVTPIITPFPKFSLNFNSHAHVERDLSWLKSNGKILVFQLTRSRGA